MCPWNRKRRHRALEAFEPRPGLLALEDLADLDAEAFAARFRRSPVKRANRRGVLRSVAIAIGKSGDASRRLVRELLTDEDPLVREHAAWALARLG